VFLLERKFRSKVRVGDNGLGGWCGRREFALTWRASGWRGRGEFLACGEKW